MFAHRFLGLLWALLFSFCASALSSGSTIGRPVSSAVPALNASSPFSTRMIQSIIVRNQGLVSSGQATSTLESGFISLAIESWLSLYASPASAEYDGHKLIDEDGATGNFTSYVDAILAAISSQDTLLNVTKAALLPLDRLTVAQAIRNLKYQADARPLTTTESLALETLNSSLVIQERNQYGGFWYYVYPSWSYLDGTVSFLPFMVSNPTASAITDAWKQIQLLFANTQHPSGLLVHGYDASKTAVWANNATGASPYVWGRSLGWYLVGLVNAWEILTTSNTAVDSPAGGAIQDQCSADDALDDCEALIYAISAQFTQLATTLITYADPATGAFYQLPTLPDAPGNYLESSSTALFTFTLLKALRLQLLSSTTNSNNATTTAIRSAALRAYDYTTRQFVIDYGNGTLGYNSTVTVCSLNSTASYEYYVNQPINFNAPLGAAAFVLASLEVERLAVPGL